ncbi:mucin-5B-like [Ascaphus truei]|uniref:mucin-5B-like n=1 Tax=Ascaphus truei TaxID=8439 RepID=UPI003F5AD4DF
MEDERGGCWNVTCTANGTVVNTYNLTTEASTGVQLYLLTVSTVAPATICQYEACTWSEWYDVSKPSPTRDGGDYETFQNIKAAGYTICKGLKDVECRASSFINTPLELLKQKVTCNTRIGLICKNTDQHTEFFQFCYNYQIRLRCCNYIPCTTGVPASTREVISTSISTTRTPKSTAMTKGKSTTQNPNMITERDIAIATVTPEEHSTIPEKPFEASATTKGPFKASTRTTAPVIASGPGPVRPTTSVSYSASTAATVVSRTTLAITQASSRTATQIQELLLLRSFSKITSKPVKSLISHVTSTIHEVKSTDQQAMLSSFYSDCLTATCSDNGNLDVKGVLCPKVKNITCEGGRPPKRIYDQDGCCYHYQCKICVGYDGTNKSPGETWIDNCLECSCDIDRLEIFCKPLDCVEPDLSICDQPWLEPFQVLTDEDRCCPKIECRCVPAYCRNLTGDCPLGYEAVGTIGEEDCCITFECKPKNVCVFKGNMYQVGKSIWTDKSSCKDCQCLDTKDPQTGLNVVSCEPIRCMTNCPLGYFYHRPQGVCCGQCVQVSCVVKMNNGSVYLLQPGESRFLSVDNCTRYTCEVIKEHMVTASKTQICPTLLEGECESGTVEKAPDGCCDVCKAAKSCKVQKKTTLISHKNCRATVTLSYCEGSCPSLRQFSMEKLSMEGTCGCCQELKTKQQEVKLTCPNGEQSIPFTFTSAESCECTTTVCTP